VMAANQGLYNGLLAAESDLVIAPSGCRGVAFQLKLFFTWLLVLPLAYMGGASASRKILLGPGANRCQLR